MIIPGLLSKPEGKIIDSIRNAAGVPKKRVAQWIAGKQISDDEAKKISKACHELGHDDDVAIMRKVLRI